MKPVYSIVIPVFNEEENIPELYAHLVSVMNGLDGAAEVVFINDGSRDRTLELLRELTARDERIRYLSFARNFGHQAAVTAGLHAVRGAATVVMDADLQDPPELLPRMIAEWKNGFHVVYAQRAARLNEGWFKRGAAYAYYRVLRYLSDVDIPADTGDFCLMDRKAVDLLNSLPERNRYIRGLRAWIGLRQTAVQFERPPRFAGEVKYTFRKSLALAIDGVIGFSRRPLRLATYLGLTAAAMALLMVVMVLLWRVFQPGSPVIGFAIIGCAIFFLAAAQLVCIGILGEYIGRIYEEVKGRPIYTLQEAGGFISDDSQVNNATGRGASTITDLAGYQASAD